MVACKGYQALPVSTGYDFVVAHRTSDMYATTAKKPGIVKSVSETGIVVEYSDGEVKGYEIGRRFGNASGLTIPHTLVTEVVVGQKLKEGDVISYNSDFFARDYFDSTQLVMKTGILVKTALFESSSTIDDPSAISERVSDLLATKITKVKNIVIAFDQQIHNLVKVKNEVNADDILCIIEDAVTASAGVFDEESLNTLRMFSAQSPQAKVKGIVERIEVFYNGDKEDMSDSLRAIAIESDIELGKRNKSIGKKAFTGSVDEGFRIDGTPLSLDSAVIKVYITTVLNASIGD